MISRDDLENPSPYKVFHGAVENPRPGVKWALFSGFGLSDGVHEKLAGLGYRIRSESPEEPQRDDLACVNIPVDDIDACMAYLRSGGAMVFVPDSASTPKVGRFVAVRKL